jgi:DNA-binding response OmpR family regulator
MDIMMLARNGYETIRNIREDPRFSLQRILALTARAMAGDREEFLEAGASDYISQPVNTAKTRIKLNCGLHAVGGKSPVSLFLSANSAKCSHIVAICRSRPLSLTFSRRWDMFTHSVAYRR